MSGSRRGWLVRAALVLAALGTLGCGGGGPTTQADCPIHASVHVNLVNEVPSGGLGATDRCRGDGSTYCTVESDLPDAVLRRVIAHELGHAWGLAHVYDGTGCVMDQNILPGFDSLCPLEVQHLSAASLGRLPLDVFPGPGLFDATAEAATLWNQSVGRVVFVVR